jgi:UDP-N-acetylmuramoyl-tripeptide--D-alanyl-D-alanine ligase
MRLPLSRVAELLSAETSLADPSKVVIGYSIDSRTIRPGELFFAVKGERFDGHDFVLQALENGAIAAVVARDKASAIEVAGRGEHAFIAVADTLLALQTLATAVRRLWGKPLIAVTGSAGKTTTKEAIAHLVAGKFRVHKSTGNFNNHFGLPLMLLKLEPEHDIAVVELGMSHAGEIATLAKIAQPDTGVVTVVAPVHLEFFESIADIARAKYELIEGLRSSGTAVLNADDEYVSQFGRGFRGEVVTYGFSPTASVRAENFAARGDQGSEFDVVAGGVHQRVLLPLVGKHNAGNALAAIATAMEHGITLADASASLATFAPADKRGEVLRLGNITVINDCYNSNPKALSEMVDALAAMPAKRRIVVAGEMLELGPQGEQMHRDSGHHIAEQKMDFLLGVRGLAQAMVAEAARSGMAASFVETPEEAGDWLAAQARDGDVILLKASRGVKLEKALEAFKSALRSPQSTAKA